MSDLPREELYSLFGALVRRTADRAAYLRGRGHQRARRADCIVRRRVRAAAAHGVGILTQGSPQMVRVNADVLRPDPSRSFAERSPVLCQVRMVDETSLIPDLGRLEDRIAAETPVLPG